MMKRVFLILAIVIFITACSSPAILTSEEKLNAAQKTADGYYELDADTANYLIGKDKSIIVLDISPNYQYNVGHLPYAVNIQIAELGTIDKERSYLVYSNDDLTSKEAAKNIALISEKPVYMLIGGYDLWAKTGYDIDTKKCHMTVSSDPPEYTHVHVWCDEESETLQFCDDSGKCHSHRIFFTMDITDKTLPGPHSHKIR